MNEFLLGADGQKLGVRNFTRSKQDGRFIEQESPADIIAAKAFWDRFGKIGGFSLTDDGDIKFDDPANVQQFVKPLNGLSLAIEQALDAVAETPLLHE